jgi:hypothetical protein
MTAWFDPFQLVSTGLQVLVSELIGTRSDYRVIESFGSPQPPYDFSNEEEIWFDYVADVGDGWNSTFTIATLLARDSLSVSTGTQPESIETTRGRILIMGGDEVYPLASRDNYQEKLVAPYESANNSSDGNQSAIFAIPGNHDWYDGLTSFTRLFCQGRNIGGWQTLQRRSYFAIKLPHRWWLWGVDIQLESDLDQPQVDYFRLVAEKMEPGDRVIVATAEPDWIYGNIYDPRLQKNLAFLEDNIIRGQAKAKLQIAIAGDLHHYRRHEAVDGSHVQLITAGGGGAFLHPTIGQPVDTIRVGADRDREFTLRQCFPSKRTSRLLLVRNFLFPIYNRKFGLLGGAAYLVIVWTLGLWVKPDNEAVFLRSILESPPAAFCIASVLLVFVAFTDTHNRLYKYFAGSLHGLAHLFGCFVAGRIAAAILHISAYRPIPLSKFIAAACVVFGAGYVISSLLMGAYLYVSLQVFQRHANEAFSALHVEDYKNFVRMYINKEGKLTVHPIGVKRVPKQWKPSERSSDNNPRLMPLDHKIEPFLIEKPIEIV